jgi:predicted AlkP superfamily pyrophosphatase or phosphodiesterase
MINETKRLSTRFLRAVMLAGTLCLAALVTKAQSSATRSAVSRPKLVVGIVVDQMRWDYLYRYYDRYGDGGFKRLLNQGFSCENTFINYLPSATAVGHSTIFTGSVPSIDGIAGNEWIDQLTGRKWYCTEDTTVHTVGSTSAEGQMSPRNLRVSTITDELRLATNFHSRVVGVSLKDRAAILPAGHAANAAFWFDNQTGRFITSTYYMDVLPDWVRLFNAENLPEKLVAHGWKTLYPMGDYTRSTPDNESWEGHLGGKKIPVFPYDIAAKYKKHHGIIRSTPFGNTLTLGFAKAAITGYRLGQERATDFLTINCASTDYAGHMFGPNSVEVEDVYLRLDKDLADFFHFLDEKIGKGNYLVFLSADHGGSHSEGFMKAHHFPTGFWDTGLADSLNAILARQTGVKQLVLTQLGIGVDYQVNYDMAQIRARHLDLSRIKKTTLAYLKSRPGILYAVDMEEIGNAPIPSRIKTMMINGYHYKRSGPIQIVPEAGWLPAYAKKGTTHGGWNPDDTHIPLIFMGWVITHGKTHRPVYMTDIAPTLAALLHVQMPNGSIGSPIEAVLKIQQKK